MREIEIKAHLRDGSAVLAKLEELGCTLSEPATQNDTVFAIKTDSIEEFVSNSVFLRIRETKGEIVFTLKYHVDRAENPGSMPLEHELKVDSRKELEAIIELLGYKEVIRIRKTRRTGKAAGFEICVDEVDELGSFIEVEQLAEHDADVEPVKEKITEFLRSLGITNEDLLVQRYDIQMLEKKFKS